MVKQGDQVQIIVNGFGNEPVTGNVIFMNPEYRTGTQIITFRAALPNPDGNFIPGTQASIFLANGNQEALTLPSNAVIRSEDGAHAWVKTGEGTFEPRVVKTGMETFSSVEILEGLRQEEDRKSVVKGKRGSVRVDIG